MPSGPELTGSRPLPLCRAYLARCRLIYTAASELAMSAPDIAALPQPSSRCRAAGQACLLSTVPMHPLCPAVPEHLILAGLSQPWPAQLRPEQLLLPVVRLWCHLQTVFVTKLFAHHVAAQPPCCLGLQPAAQPHCCTLVYGLPAWATEKSRHTVCQVTPSPGQPAAASLHPPAGATSFNGPCSTAWWS